MSVRQLEDPEHFREKMRAAIAAGKPNLPSNAMEVLESCLANRRHTITAFCAPCEADLGEHWHGRNRRFLPDELEAFVAKYGLEH